MRMNAAQVEAILSTNMDSINPKRHSVTFNNRDNIAKKILADKLTEKGPYSVKIQGVTDIDELSFDALNMVSKRLQNTKTSHKTFRDLGKGRKVLLKEFF